MSSPQAVNCVIVDITNLFIMHYTANPTLDKNGNPVGGVAGTFAALCAIARRLSPRRMIVVWDGSGGSSQKRAVFSEYKGNRAPGHVGRLYSFTTQEAADANRKWQIALLRQIIGYLPVCQIVTDGIEADDAIGYIANNAEYFGHTQTYIVSCDKDFYQMIGENVFVYNPQSKKILDRQIIKTDFECASHNWLFFRALNGDKSDNIDGVKGFGIKTIGKLFDLVGDEVLTPASIKQQLDVVQDTKKKDKLAKLAENIDLIERNWQIMSLKDAMISMSAKDKLTDKVKNFVPSFNKISLYIEIRRLDASINPDAATSLSLLLANR